MKYVMNAAQGGILNDLHFDPLYPSFVLDTEPRGHDPKLLGKLILFSAPTIAIDMPPPYILAVSENLPTAAIVFDHFHRIELSNDKPSNLRRDLQRQVEKKGS